MDDKSFEIIEKIYADLQETKKNMCRIESKVDNTQKEVVKLGIKIEHDVSNKVQILFEAQQRYSRTFPCAHRYCYCPL